MPCNLAVSITKVALTGPAASLVTPEAVRALVEAHLLEAFGVTSQVYVSNGSVYGSATVRGEGVSIAVCGGQVTVRAVTAATREAILAGLTGLLGQAGELALASAVAEVLAEFGGDLVADQVAVDDGGTVRPAHRLTLNF
jgi:hypothetical protein